MSKIGQLKYFNNKDITVFEKLILTIFSCFFSKI